VEPWKIHDRAHGAAVTGRPTLPLLVSAALTFCGEPVHASQSRPVSNIELQTGDGAKVRLTDFVGHVVLVDFWASWCVPCRKSFPAIDTLYRRYHSRGLDVLAVNMDERRRDADAFLSTHSHVMPIFFDARGDALKGFALAGVPSSLIIDRRGHIRFTHAGYSDKIVEEYRPEIEALLREDEKPGR
jgi:cytochrome c biogenesis protein CcmG/thiol:disulfide interchange protein DsbE